MTVEWETLLIHIPKIPGSDPVQETGYPERSFFRGFHKSLQANVGLVPQITPRTSSFHILSNSLIAIPFDPMYYEILTAPLNKPLINNQIDADGE